jgi:uncharacterized RDD family membrane protein YckC
MEIWIIRDGEKVGPIHDYDIRRKIETGELTRDVPGWHEGLSSWRPLVEMPLFKDEFDYVHTGDLSGSQSSDDEFEPLRKESKPPPLPVALPLGRRFWARWLDVHAYLAVWWLTMWASGRNIEVALGSIVLLVLQLVPWFIAESILIHRFGTTPGKWLMGLRVVNVDGSPLSLAAATLRSFRILVGGIGFGWGLLALFCQAFSYFSIRRLGNPLWDHAGGHRVVADKPIAAWRIITLTIVLFAAIQMQMAVIAPYVIKNAAESFPFLKETLEKNPPWHLPERNEASPPEKAPLKG